MEDEFYTHVTLEEVATELNMRPQYCELFYNYWKLKRKVDILGHLLCSNHFRCVCNQFRVITTTHSYQSLMSKMLLKRSKKTCCRSLRLVKTIDWMNDLIKSLNNLLKFTSNLVIRVASHLNTPFGTYDMYCMYTSVLSMCYNLYGFVMSLFNGVRFHICSLEK